MADKKNNNEKEVLSKKEQAKFNNIMIVPIATLLSVIGFYDRLAYFCAKMFLGGESEFYQLKITVFEVMFAAVLILWVIVAVRFCDKAVKLGLEFKQYFSLKNDKAKKQVKKAGIATAAIIICAAGLFCLSGQCSYVGGENGISSYSVFSDNENFLLYKDVKSAEIKAGYDPGIHFMSDNYIIIISLKTENNEVKLRQTSFGGYEGMEKLLSRIEKSVISVDETSMQLITIKNAKAKKAFDDFIAKYK